MNGSSRPTGPEIGRFVEADGLATNVLDEGPVAPGAGRTPVLLLHGSGPGVTAWANWRLVVPELARERRVVAPDLVGFGYTERPASLDLGLGDWVRHLAAVLDALGIGTADLVGNSFGGALALAFTLAHPHRVRRLVLMGSVGLVFELTPALDAVWGYEPSPETMRELLTSFVVDESIVTPELVRSRYEASVRPGFQEAYAALFPAPRQRHIERLASDEAAVAALGHRTLVVHGRDDRVIPVEVGIRLHRLIADSELHLFGRCGHWTQIERRDRFVAVVGDFLDAP